MPIYEYQCQACQHELEALQKISDAPLEVCPDCGERSLRKKVSAVAFRLKGGGWYETDFKTGEKKNIAGGAEPTSEKAAPEKGSPDKSTTDKSTSDKAATTKGGDKPPAKSSGGSTGKGDSSARNSSAAAG